MAFVVDVEVGDFASRFIVFGGRLEVDEGWGRVRDEVEWNLVI